MNSNNAKDYLPLVEAMAAENGKGNPVLFREVMD